MGKGKTETVKQAVRRYGRVHVNDQNITKVIVPQLAGDFKVSQEQVQTALRELAAEQGSGWHGSGNHYEFRFDERRAARRQSDTHVAERCLEYMRGTEPGSLVPVRTISEAIDARNSSVSSSMAMLAQDKWLHLVKIRRGVYSYRPPSWQEDELPYQTAEREERERAMLAARPDGPPAVPVQPLPAPITGLTPSALRDLERARLGDQEQQAARELWTFPPPYYEPETHYSDALAPGTDYIPDGQYRQLTVTSTGTVLVEDAKGAVYELLPLRRPS